MTKGNNKNLGEQKGQNMLGVQMYQYYLECEQIQLMDKKRILYWIFKNLAIIGHTSQGLWDGHIYTAKFKKGNQQRPTVQDMELCSTLCASLDERGVWGRMDTCVCMAESLRCSLESTTRLLIGYTPHYKMKHLKSKKITIVNWIYPHYKMKSLKS